MSGPIKLPVRVVTVSNTHRLIDADDRHWFSFFAGNEQGNLSPLPQIAHALNRLELLESRSPRSSGSNNR